MSFEGRTHDSSSLLPTPSRAQQLYQSIQQSLAGNAVGSLVSPLSARLYASPFAPWLAMVHSATVTSSTCTVLMRSFSVHSNCSAAKFVGGWVEGRKKGGGGKRGWKGGAKGDERTQCSWPASLYLHGFTKLLVHGTNDQAWHCKKKQRRRMRLHVSKPGNGGRRGRKGEQEGEGGRRRGEGCFIVRCGLGDCAQLTETESV